MFNKHILDFNENIIGLRDFIDLIEPFLNDKREEHDKHISPLISLGILKEIASTKTEWEDGEREKHKEFTESITKQILEIYKREVDVELEIDKSDVNEKGGKGIRMKFKATETPELKNHIENVQKVTNHIELLYKNSFISLLTTVEWFFSQILHFNYDKFPESAGIQKKTMTLADLKSFGTIEDAEKILIDTKIEEVLRGNLESWFTTLKTDLNLKLGYIEPIKEELIEIYQRRNLFVHNGGIVNTIYISKVSEEFRKNINLNDSLVINKKYLDNAICKLQKAFILIASELWKKLDKSDKSRGEVLTDIVYENLLKERWDICEGLTFFIIKDAELEVTDKLVAQLNYWLCKKEQNQYNSVKNEIDNANYSDKKEIFQLALFALKDDIDSFMEILPISLDSRQLSIIRLEEFPIFKTIRQTEEYIKFKTESKYFTDSNIEIEDYE